MLKIITVTGFSLKDTMPSVQIVHDIRNAEISPLQGDYHPLIKHKLSAHPFEIDRKQ